MIVVYQYKRLPENRFLVKSNLFPISNRNKAIFPEEMGQKSRFNRNVRWVFYFGGLTSVIILYWAKLESTEAFL
jgi:hypothetical protein